MVGQGKEAEGGILNLVLDRSKYQKPPDCSCGISYNKHGTEYPQLTPALASWRGVYFRERYFHRNTHNCDNDATSLRIGPDAYLSQWSEPLLDSLYVLGLSSGMIFHLFPEDVISQTTVWRRVHHIDPQELNLRNLLYNRLAHDLNRWSKKDEKKDIFEFFTMTVLEPPTVGWEVAVRRPIHQLTLRWIEQRALRSQQHPTQGNLSFQLT